VSTDSVTEALREPADRAFQPVVLKRADPPAGLANDVVVVVAIRDDALIARSTSADLDPLHEADPLQQVQRPVHARRSDAATLLPKARGDVLRAKAAVLLGEEVDHRPSRAAGPLPGALERLVGELGPGALRGRHPPENTPAVRMIIIPAHVDENDFH
jgi:hypothetical protein